MNIENKSKPSAPRKSVPYDEFVNKRPHVIELLENVRSIAERRRQTLQADATESIFDIRYSSLGEFIGVGEEKLTFKIDTYAVKVLHDNQSTSYDFQDQVESLKAGAGVEGLEQLVTFDETERVIVTALVKGKSISHIPALRLARKITIQHIEKLQKTLGAMREKGISYDNPSNVMFDPEDGFTIVDYRSKDKSTLSTDDSECPELSIDGFLEDILSHRHKERRNVYAHHGEPMLDFVPRNIIGFAALASTVAIKANKAKKRAKR